MIIGGGIAGLATAYELAKRGLDDVVLVERNYIGCGSSTRNVCRQRKFQVDRELALLSWASQKKWDELTTELNFNILLRRCSYMLLQYTEEEVAMMKDAVKMNNSLGIKCRYLSPGDVYELEPLLKEGTPVTGAVFAKERIFHHDAVIWAYSQAAQRLGVEINSGVEVTGLRIVDGRIRVTTKKSEIETSIAVNAAGPYSVEIAKMLGVELPIKRVRREALATESMKPFLNSVIAFYKPMEGWFHQTLRGEVVGGVIDPDEPGASLKSSFGFLVRTATVLTAKIPRIRYLKVIRQWGGVYGNTPDHFPIIGETDGIEGFYQINGFSGRGMNLAPIVADLLADLVVYGKTSRLIEPYRLSKERKEMPYTPTRIP